MLFFGYVVSDNNCKDLNGDFIKPVKSLDECTKDLPKLIVGLDNAKKYAADNSFEFDILNNTYPNGDMWTFKKTEKRDYYEDDLFKFKKMIINHQESGVKYYYINIYSLKYSQIKRLYNLLRNKDVNYIIVDGEMLYIPLNSVDVIGISFVSAKYIGISRESIINKLKKFRNNKIYYTSFKNMYELKDLFRGKEYVIANIFENNHKN